MRSLATGNLALQLALLQCTVASRSGGEDCGDTHVSHESTSQSLERQNAQAKKLPRALTTRYEKTGVPFGPKVPQHHQHYLSEFASGPFRGSCRALASYRCVCFVPVFLRVAKPCGVPITNCDSALQTIPHTTRCPTTPYTRQCLGKIMSVVSLGVAETTRVTRVYNSRAPCAGG